MYKAAAVQVSAIEQVAAHYGLTKEALIGPMLELNMLGLPSAMGYLGGYAGMGPRKEHTQMSDEELQEERKRGYSAFKGLFVPGYSGYHYGRRAGAREEQRNRDRTEFLKQLARGQQSAQIPNPGDTPEAR